MTTHRDAHQPKLRDLPLRASSDIRGGSTVSTTLKTLGSALATMARKQ